MNIAQNSEVTVKTTDKGQAGFFNGKTGKVLEVVSCGIGTSFMIKVEFDLEDDSGFYKDICSFRPDELIC